MRRVFSWLLALVLVAIVAGGAYVRLAPLPDPVSAAEVTPPNSPNWAWAVPAERRARGDLIRPAPIYRADPTTVLTALEAVAAEQPRVASLAAPDGPDSRAFAQRSFLVGYPDLLSARATDLGDGRTELALYSHSIYGHSDLGVNAARLDAWITDLDARLERAP